MSQDFIHDDAFIQWLRTQGGPDPDWWQSEYSGNIYFAHDAWLAGQAATTTETARVLIRDNIEGARR